MWRLPMMMGKRMRGGIQLEIGEVRIKGKKYSVRWRVNLGGRDRE